MRHNLYRYDNNDNVERSNADTTTERARKREKSFKSFSDVTQSVIKILI